MIIAERFVERVHALDISQAELARRVGVSQKTINKLALGLAYGSRHLHRIARELRTSTAYLEGEVDDPSPDLSSLPAAARPRVQHLPLTVALPDESALARAFERALASTRNMDDAMRARELARRLPKLLETRQAFGHMDEDGEGTGGTGGE